MLASTVPNYIQPRPVIVTWSSLYRARIGCAMNQSLPARAGIRHFWGLSPALRFAAIPDHHGAAAVFALRDGAFERVVFDRMVPRGVPTWLRRHVEFAFLAFN